MKRTTPRKSNNIKQESTKDFQWRQFCRLGEMIGDGLHNEEKWISREYRHLQRILLPETKEERKIKNDSINRQMEALLNKIPCKKCGSKLIQTRKGAKTAICTSCGIRYKAKTKNRKSYEKRTNNAGR